MLDRALGHHRAGRLKEAEAIYRQILAQDPQDAEALHLLGVLMAQTGRPEEGLSLIEHAIAGSPYTAGYHNSRGQVLHVLGHLEAVIQAYRQAVNLNRADAQAHQNLGDALVESDKLDEAIAVYRRAITLVSDSPELHNNLAMAFEVQGNLEEAITYFERALAFKPESPDINYNLGNALQRNGNLPEAVMAYRRALALRPDFAEAHNNLGTALAEQENLSDAIACYERAIALNADYVQAYSNLGSALRQANRLTDAVTTLQHALTLNPRYADAYHNLAGALLTRGQVTEAIAAYQQALALKPKANTHSSLVFCMHYDPTITPKALFAETSRWHEQHVLPLTKAIAPHANTAQPARPLCMGYLSPDFHAHSVAYFVEALLAEHDRERFGVFCYANVKHPDAVTERFRGLADHWRDIAWLDDSTVAEQIRTDKIDILVDLAGHTRNNRLLLFARKPAPIQVTYLGYPDTTGLRTIDYRLTDALADPPGKTDAFHTEILVRLPRGFLCYQPPADTPMTQPLPALSAGHITFGSFNAAAKVNEHVIACWAMILKALPRSQLILKARPLADTGTRALWQAVFDKYGIGTERIQIYPWMPVAEHLQLYNKVDIALDPFPYNGTTTTCEATWMGVPVVTLAGTMHAGRVGVSLLTHAGLPELIAENPEDYVKITVALASDVGRLKDLRQGLRERLQRCPLVDAAGFTRSLEVAYREMWRKYCESSGK
jgi:predicted O-linked N-acetylglucosamine transferase (SPINDLY family)